MINFLLFFILKFNQLNIHVYVYFSVDALSVIAQKGCYKE